ncbi:hypothetical protein LMG31886_37580 [Xanthomonas hydrangeae]|nr:hypothetical protein LMG31885_22820 [Xanthomonas hydrangeae]CAD7735264.1 hypothetical protein LMG31885_22820 [Xanthomonas hydrangeae]CAD7744665.1 hypothetical protein LMG31886_37580 [Xanthomonas hydrangeae]CAD7744668.1 hypothetical protein LMG31886_37580 [Xanthomonas hydrangeae]
MRHAQHPFSASRHRLDGGRRGLLLADGCGHEAAVCALPAAAGHLAARRRLAAVRADVGFATAGPRSIVPVRWGLHLLRGVLGMVMIGCFVYGLKRMPLSTA